MGQKMPFDTTPDAADVQNYINDMLMELAIMASQAGHIDLARRLGDAIDQPPLFARPQINEPGRAHTVKRGPASRRRRSQLAGTSGFQA